MLVLSELHIFLKVFVIELNNFFSQILILSQLPNEHKVESKKDSKSTYVYGIGAPLIITNWIQWELLSTLCRWQDLQELIKL